MYWCKKNTQPLIPLMTYQDRLFAITTATITTTTTTAAAAAAATTTTTTTAAIALKEYSLNLVKIKMLGRDV